MALDQIIWNHPGQIAAVDVHYPAGNHFYLQEATERIQYYPPPFAGMYVPPWMWFDGNNHSSMDYSIWESLIVDRMSEEAPVTITMDGAYSTGDDTGTVFVNIRNDSTAEISGRVIIVITEDSLVYAAPNGVMVHNSVPRDYIPDDSGTTVTIPAGDSVTVTQAIIASSGWVDANLNLLAWIQNDIEQPDSTKEIWQSAIVKLVELGIAEHGAPAARSILQPAPNPCVDGTSFLFSLAPGERYSIRLFDIAGREIRTYTGTARDTRERVYWNLKDKHGDAVAQGVYFYRFDSGNSAATGKIVVR
ncbi:MAG TPA: Omp28-related outer membrane protein [bacterium]